jgi:hypothetical protein
VEETQIAARWACFDVAPMFPDGALGSNTPPTDAFFSVQHCMGVGLPVGAGGVECVTTRSGESGGCLRMWWA